MATKRPAKLAIGKKAQQVPMHPSSGKPMTCVKVFRQTGGSSMRWLVLEDFDGSEKSAADMLPVR
ncbi:MAG: hypothetical protein ACI81R_002615 [Bradymonadia bacterium]|jgi:hypothetical protein